MKVSQSASPSWSVDKCRALEIFSIFMDEWSTCFVFKVIGEQWRIQTPVPALEGCQRCDGRGPMGVRGPGPGIRYPQPLVHRIPRTRARCATTAECEEAEESRRDGAAADSTHLSRSHRDTEQITNQDRARPGGDQGGRLATDRALQGLGWQARLDQPITVVYSRSSLHQSLVHKSSIRP